MYDNKVYASVTNEPGGQGFSLIAFKITYYYNSDYVFTMNFYATDVSKN